jgi:PPP family 3-phenylpropionic acid transporter
LIAFFLLGVSFSILPPFVERVAVERLGHHYGRSRLIGSLTFLSGGFIHPPGIGVLGVVFGLLIISSLLSLLIYHHHTAQKRGPDPLEFSFKKGWHFWVALVVMKTATVGFYTFFTIYMHQHGLGEYVGVFWLVSIVVEVALFLAQPKVMAHLSPMGAMGISLLATALRWFILCLFPDSFWMVLFSQLLHATTFALFHIGAMSFLNSTYPNKTLAQQFYGGLGYGLSWFLGSWLAGLLYPYHLFCWEGVLTLIAFGILEMGRGRRGS